jgi:isopenicillin-N epimerase
MDPSSALASYFLIDPAITFLNHGSFGATPIPVFERYQYWQRELERQRYQELMHTARKALAAYLGCDADDLVYVINATTGVNIVARSLDLGPDDEVLTTNHEYGACDRAWRFLAGERGFTYRAATLPYPLTDPAEVVEAIWSEVTPRTRMIYLSHLTSPTAVILPVVALCRRARAAGILTHIDGAHAPGQLPLDLETLGVDFYTGNLHKWVCAPKGAAFLHVRRDLHPRARPVMVSHGANSTRADRSRFRLEWDWTGTCDPTAFLSAPEALRWMEAQLPGGWDAVRRVNRELALRARSLLCEALGGPPSAPDSMVGSMAAVALPPALVGEEPSEATGWLDPLQRVLREECRIEVPVIPWPNAGSRWIRVSAQVYNEWREYEALAGVLKVRRAAT